MKRKLLFLSLCVSLLNGCGVTVKNIKVCTPAGLVSAGANCAWTLSDETEEMTFEEFVAFLEAQPERPDPQDPTKKLPARGSAMCTSAEDWNSQATALAQLCKRAGPFCTKDDKRKIKEAWLRLRKLQDAALAAKGIVP